MGLPISIISDLLENFDNKNKLENLCKFLWQFIQLPPDTHSYLPFQDNKTLVLAQHLAAQPEKNYIYQSSLQ